MTHPQTRRRATRLPRNWWRGKDSNLRRRKPADLQSAPVGRLGTPPGKNEPRILVTTPRGVNGIGATFAKTWRALRLAVSGPSGRHIYIDVSATPNWPAGAPEARFAP